MRKSYTDNLQYYFQQVKQLKTNKLNQFSYISIAILIQFNIINISSNNYPMSEAEVQSQVQEFSFNFINVLLIVGIATMTTSISELASWFLLYRKDQYKYRKLDIEKLNKKLEKLKSTHVIGSSSKIFQKKLAATQSQLKNLNQQMTFQSLKSNLLVGVLMIGVINMIGTYFQGIVVVKLPFEPFSLIQGMFHRNIQGTDFTQAAYLPIYIMSTFILRSNIKKMFGFQPPKSAVTFFDPPKFKPE